MSQVVGPVVGMGTSLVISSNFFLVESTFFSKRVSLGATPVFSLCKSFFKVDRAGLSLDTDSFKLVTWG